MCLVVDSVICACMEMVVLKVTGTACAQGLDFCATPLLKSPLFLKKIN